MGADFSKNKVVVTNKPQSQHALCCQAKDKKTYDEKTEPQPQHNLCCSSNNKVASTESKNGGCCQPKEKKSDDFYFQTDINGQNVFHRAAQNFSLSIYNEAQEFYEQINPDLLKQPDWTNQSEKNNGVTPLQAAVMNYRVDLQDERAKFIEYKIKFLKCEVNTMNTHSLWTPLHWAARYGDVQTIQLLIEKKVIAFTPDSKCLFPIDLAGYFQNWKALKLLVDYSIECFKDLMARTIQDQLKEDFFLGEQVFNEDLFKHSDKFLASPIYASKLLYWAARNQLNTTDQVDFILKNMESYPEAVLPLSFSQTAIHGAAMSGSNKEKLDLMCSEYRLRHLDNQQKLKQPENQNTRKHIKWSCRGKYCECNGTTSFAFIRKNTKVKFISENIDGVILQLKSLKKFRKLIQDFWETLQKLHQQPLTFDIPDYHQNTPLHLAAMVGSDTMTKSLIEQWKCSFDKRNLQGVMAKNMGAWYPSIQKVFNIYLNSVQIKLLNKQGDIQQLISTQKNSLGLESVFESRKLLPKVPSVALRLKAKNEVDKQKVNYIIRTLTADLFLIHVFKSVFVNEYIVTLDLSQQELEKEAQGMIYALKLSEQNTKVSYSTQLRDKMTPFSNKDKIVLVNQRLLKVFGINDMKRLDVFISITQMHNQQEIYYLKKMQNEKSILQSLSCRNLKNKELPKDLVALENYFGITEVLWNEQKMHMFIFFIPVTIYGIYISIQQWISTTSYIDYSTNTYLINVPEQGHCFIFAILVCIWFTLSFEFWKRKENQIKQIIGLNQQEEYTAQINRNFLGYQAFSWKKFALTKKSNTKYWQLIWFALLSIFFILMTAISIGLYVILEIYVKNTAIRGFIISIISSLTSYILQLGASRLITKSNMKYVDEEKVCFTIIILIFQFIVVHLPIVYAILDPDDKYIEEVSWRNNEFQFKQNHYSKMYNLVFTIIGTKIATLLIFQYLIPSIWFCIIRCRYFSKVKSMSHKQTSDYLTNSNLSQDEIKQLQSKGSASFFQNIVPAYEKPEQPKKSIFCCQKGEKQPDTYSRLVQNLENGKNNGVSKNQIFVDEIELNSLKPEFIDVDIISHISQKNMILSIGCLYSGICPIATVIAMFFYFFDYFCELQSNLFTIKRSFPELNSTRSIWNTFAYFLTLMTVITNSYMLLYYSTEYEKDIRKQFQIDGPVLFVVVIQEHIILIVLIGIQIFIPDLSKQIKNRISRSKGEVENLLVGGDVKCFKNEDTQVAQLKNQIQQLQQQLQNAKKVDLKPKSALEIINYHQKEKNEIEIRDGKLSDFLKIDPRIHEYQKIKDQMEISLKVNLEIRLFRETFYLIERAVLSSKLSKVFQFSKFIQIACCQCIERLSSLYCSECQDHFCENCNKQVHSIDPNMNHHVNQMNLDPSNSIKSQNILQKKPNETVWRKFQYFNFPLDPQNTKLYQQIQVHFEHLRKVYLDLNYINFGGQIDIASVLVDQNYDCLTRDEGNKMYQNHLKYYGNVNILAQKEMINVDDFNHEELFYLNRVVFNILKQSGSQIRFDTFIADLQTLQHGDLNSRLKLWLNLMNDAEDTIQMKRDINIKTNNIQKTKFAQIIKLSNAQDLTGLTTVESIVDQIFGSKTMLQADEIIQKITSSKEALSLVGCVIQWSQ